MNTNITFLNIVAEYCNTPADEITNDMRFIEDLGFSSLDFMTFSATLKIHLTWKSMKMRSSIFTL